MTKRVTFFKNTVENNPRCSEVVKTKALWDVYKKLGASEKKINTNKKCLFVRLIRSFFLFLLLKFSTSVPVFFFFIFFFFS